MANDTPIRELYSVEQVAERLGLHVRTVRKYVRDGRLRAVRIGKQYRIAREDLDAFTGRVAAPTVRNDVRRERHVELSSIVTVDAVSPVDAGRISNGLMGAAKGRDEGDGPLRIDTIYDETRGRLKIIVTGNLETTTYLLRLITAYLQ
jgi:excisionase family DNA binding protein